MSHVVTIQTKIHDPAAIAAACQRLNLLAPAHKTVELFSGAATGFAVQLPGWQYPVVIDALTGSMQFDNYEGHWGEQKELDHFMQAYAIEKARIEARRKGHQVYETPLEGGSIKLQIIECS